MIHNFPQDIIRFFSQKLPVKVIPDCVQFHPNKDLYTTFIQVCHPNGHPAEGAILSPSPDFIEAASISEEKNQENSHYENDSVSFCTEKDSNTLPLGVLHKFSSFHQLWLDRLEKKFSDKNLFLNETYYGDILKNTIFLKNSTIL